MFTPWNPTKRNLTLHPSLKWFVKDRSLTVKATFESDNPFSIIIKFEESLASIRSVDESTYQSTNDLPLPNQLNNTNSIDLSYHKSFTILINSVVALRT